MFIAKDTVLMLSGVPCVGKTTTAYEIVKKYDEFRRISELDILRTVVRSVFEHVATEDNISKEQIFNKYKALFESLTNGSLETAKQQSILLLPYIKEIVTRQQRRKIPTIIEGAEIVPSTYFPNDRPLDWITKNVIFINLYLSDENEHITRRQIRSAERNYSENIVETRKIITSARTEKNRELHLETIKLSQQFHNVFSLDVSNISPSALADMIMEKIHQYFKSHLNT